MARIQSEMRPWLAARIKELPGRSKAGLARALRLPPARVHEMVKGTRGIYATEVADMARYLDWTGKQLLEAIRTNAMPRLDFLVPQIGEIIDGGEVRASGNLAVGTPIPMVKGPPMIEDGERSLDALLVDTDDLEPRYYKGEHVFFASVGQTDWEQLLGVECVVKRLDGSLAIRVIQRNSDGSLLLLVPFRNLIEPAAAIEWAAPIEYVTRKIRRRAP